MIWLEDCPKQNNNQQVDYIFLFLPRNEYIYLFLSRKAYVHHLNNKRRGKDLNSWETSPYRGAYELFLVNVFIIHFDVQTGRMHNTS